MVLQQDKSSEQIARETIEEHEKLCEKFKTLMLEENSYYAEWCMLIAGNPLADLAFSTLFLDDRFDRYDLAHIICKLLREQWRDLEIMTQNNNALRREIEMLKKN